MPACFRPPHYHRIINQVDEIYIYAQNLDGSSIVIRNTCYYNLIQSPMFKLLEGFQWAQQYCNTRYPVPVILFLHLHHNQK